MRYSFRNLTQIKKSSKVIATVTDASLARVQKAVAKIFGYSDWHDLEKNHSKVTPFAADQCIPRSEFIERQAALALALAKELGIPDSDAQHCLALTHLTGNMPSSIFDQIEIRIRCWRQTIIPLAKKRAPGAVGKLNVTGRKNEPVILKSFSNPTTVITHNGVATIADFEYVSPREPDELFVPTRLYLPYGVWTERDGSEVLFSRDYKPLWRIRKGKKPERLNPWIWIQVSGERWFWNDSNSPWRSPETRERIQNLLNSYSIRTLPILADALPLLITTNLDRFSMAANALEIERDGGKKAA